MKKAVAGKLFLYIFLCVTGFVFLYPLLKMLSMSLMAPDDLVNPLVNWVPYGFETANFSKAVQVLGYGETLWTTIYVSVLPALLQTLVCALTGYGIARYRFKGKNILFGLILATFIIPSQITMIPQFLMYKNLGILYSLKAYLLPAVFGQGIRSAIFILIFVLFFQQVPVSLTEAAEIDGANQIVIFTKIAVPVAKPGFLISFLLSVVWYWNETYLGSLYFGANIKTLPMKLENFVETFNKMVSASEAGAGATANEAVQMAGTFLIILPLLILFFCAQKQFIEGIEKTGITGE
ncbi:L-arabinose transport system permease protein AraQ [Lachnospiraceae bacterium]|nr:carbohydrate ABC transporter permease [Acetatifactor sp.]GFH93559.1 L-arabinose transport system permease protein AraQ [Lachnospiraceae bacterium]